MKKLTIATRKSPLALWQAEFIKSQLQQHDPGLEVELNAMTTRGDQLLDSPLSKIGGKGLFVKELENMLLDGSADIAVHSMKDVPMFFPDGLCLGPICKRGSPFDAFVSNQYDSLDDLPHGALIGTSSLRRQVQIQHHRPDIRVKSLRGNVQTRLGKLDNGEFDAIVLAVSGLERMQLDHRMTAVLPDNICLPACGQGALGIEHRSSDKDVAERVAVLADRHTTFCVTAERAMNTRLEGGCQVPIAGFAELDGNMLHLRGLVGSLDGKLMLHASHTLPAEEAEQLGVTVAEKLLDQGAGEILKAVYQS